MTDLNAQDRLAALEVILNALAHPARRQILMAIHFRGEAVTAGDLAARFKHAWPTTTRHLRVLEDAGLIKKTKKGRSQLYIMNPAPLDILREWLDWLK